MENKTSETLMTHHGNAIKRFRRMLGIKQEALAADMGISQALVSMYEKKRVIEADMVVKFAKALNIDPKLIEDLEVDPVTYIIENRLFSKECKQENGVIEHRAINHYPDPFQRFIELSNQKIDLYEQLLLIERERKQLFEKFFSDRND